LKVVLDTRSGSG